MTVLKSHGHSWFAIRLPVCVLLISPYSSIYSSLWTHITIIISIQCDHYHKARGDGPGSAARHQRLHPILMSSYPMAVLCLLPNRIITTSLFNSYYEIIYYYFGFKYQILIYLWCGVWGKILCSSPFSFLMLLLLLVWTLTRWFLEDYSIGLISRFSEYLWIN